LEPTVSVSLLAVLDSLEPLEEELPTVFGAGVRSAATIF
jgi:hypothetical protein